MAVSKLSCPACWEYLDILSKFERQRGKAEMYAIRGRHSTVYPVQLPIWSRPDVVQELIKRFCQYLRSELDTMWTNHLREQEKANRVSKSGHRHNPSLQSVSSAITNASEMSTESNLNDLNNLLPVPDVKRGVRENEA